MSTPNTIPDQADLVAQYEQATADLATAKQTIGSLQTANEKLTGEKTAADSLLTEAQTNLTNVTSERDKLTAENTTLKADKATLATENARLQNEMKDFNARVAAEVAAKGIRPTAVPVEAKTENAKLSADELIAAVKAGTMTSAEAVAALRSRPKN